MNIDKLLHQAHLRHQRKALSGVRHDMPCNEVRGCRREPSRHERDVQWLSQWSTGLRPNFFKAYFETLEYMSKQ